MCGIFGFVAGPQAELSFESVRSTIDMQFKLADSRGKEASGWAIRTRDNITVYKQPISGTELTRSTGHRNLFRQAICNGQQAGGNGSPDNGQQTNGSRLHAPLAIIGHSRLVTNGRESENDNNQSVVRNDGILILMLTLKRLFMSSGMLLI